MLQALILIHQTKSHNMAYKILSTLGQRVSDTLKKLPAYAQSVLENKQNQYNELLQETDEVALKNIVTQKAYNIMEILQYYSQLLSDIDKEVKKIVDAQYEHAKNLLSENRDMLEYIAHNLLEKETLDEKEFEALMNEVKSKRENEI